MTTFKEYHDLYFRGFATREHDLDPLQYYNAPGFSWDAMFKLTTTSRYGEVTTRHLDLLLDSDQGLFIKKGIRG